MHSWDVPKIGIFSKSAKSSQNCSLVNKGSQVFAIFPKAVETHTFGLAKTAAGRLEAKIKNALRSAAREL